MRGFVVDQLLSRNIAMWVLVALVILLVSYTVERGLFLHGGKIKPQQFLGGVISLLRNGRYNEALTVCEGSPGTTALIVKTALAFGGKAQTELSHAVNNVALLEIPLLERRLGSIRLIAKVAPLISFVGVLQVLAGVLGEIKHGVSYFSANVVISFMHQAMGLVAFGLTVNILGTLSYSFLYGRVRRLAHDMEWSCNEILNYLVVSKRTENAVPDR
ncbi:MAG: MotA/TolQ/ExbB proton channel family protein [Puniceicoccales bacterium]|nr:MotA/TolQ/ExbB proton channel family protein [Puniceicoccales bacterium]